jgi:ABC-type oligopeptide transport system substrate-binding subunit/DNA-binding SARP family transcriptional activator
MSDQSNNSWLRLRFLGGCDIQCPNGPVHLETAKTSALLAYLTMQPGPQQRHKLMGLLWGDLPEPNARRNLRRALWDLRRKLDHPDVPSFILATHQTVEFNRESDYWLDAKEFERLANCETGKAVELYRGDLLEGFYVHDAPAFEEWVLAERERLRTLVLPALQRLVEYHTARGEYAAGTEYTTRLLALDPWREEAHRELMRLLALTGQRSAALTQYEECRRLLEAELGLEPLEETTTLYERIRQGIEEMALPHSRTSAPSLPFVGREAEHATLMNWWKASQHDAGHLALVEGETGVGKTRLVEEVIRYAEAQGAIVLRGHCYEFGSGVPYQPIAEALREVLSRGTEEQERREETSTPSPLRTLAPVWLAELSRLLPELQLACPDLPEPMDAFGEAARQRLFEAVVHFLQAEVECRRPGLSTAEGSVIVFLDDLHWSDQSTLDLLHYLVRRLTETPIWFVGAYRPEEVSLNHPLTRLRQGLGRDHRADRLALEPLSGEAVKELARSLVGEQEGTTLGDLLYRESEGNPFILIETVNDLQEQGALVASPAASLGTGDVAPLPGQDGHWVWTGAPPVETLPTSVQDIVLQRVGRLGEPAQQLLTLAAVIGRQFDAALLQAAAGLDADVVNENLDEWLARRLINPQSGIGLGTWDFTHDKIRAVVYHAAGRDRRRMFHQRVGEVLERLFPDRIEEQVGLLAHHWEQAEEPAKATEYLLRAGDQARLVYAHQEAVDYYQRALAFLKSQGDAGRERAARTLLRLGLTYHNAFDFQRSRQAYDEGFALWQQASQTPEKAQPTAPHPLKTTWDDPPTLDSTMADDITSIGLINQLFSGLVGLSAEMGVEPGIAHHWEVLEGGRKFVFHLRNDVRWSDGVPVTAEDFVYAWKRNLDPATGSPVANLLYDVKGARAFHRGEAGREDIGVRALDEFTLLVELDEPTGYFLQLLTQSACYPVPRHVVEAHGEAWTEVGNIVTNGPFRLDIWSQGQSIVLSRNPGYHGRFTGNLERVELLLQRMEPAAKLEMYEADGLDILDLPSLEVDRARQNHAGEFISFPTLYTEYVGFDASRPPFDDPRVRRAFALATDRETLANVAFRGYVSPATGGFVPPGIPGHSVGIGLPYDPEQARRLLAEAGYPDGRGFPDVDSPTRRAVLPHPEYLQTQWWENLGIEITWDVMEWAIYLEKLEEPPHMFLMGWLADYHDPDNFLRVGLWRERVRWQNEGYDRLVEEARRVTDQGARMQLYRQAERILVEEAAIIPLYYGRQHLLVKPWVSKFLPTSAAGRPRWKDVVIEPHW